MPRGPRFVPRKRDDIDDALRLIRGGEPKADGPVWRTAYPPDDAPIVKKDYAAVARVLLSISEKYRPDLSTLLKELAGVTVSDQETMRLRAVQMRERFFLKELAGLFDPENNGNNRKVTVGFRGHGSVDKVHNVTIALLVE